MLKRFNKSVVALSMTLMAGLTLAGSVHAQQKTIAIGTGGTGGVY
jgi:TRAP-type uncharacterized transport system substrate-binding protein